MVVKAVMNASFGTILETKKGALPLYTFDMGTCTPANSCSTTIWPPLLMPKGKTMPGGVPTGLGTQPFGTGRLQVTYNGSPLYTFYMDHKNTVNGNGLGGFSVATVS
jgi:predicted lipoprotein with Yx(FWY)xxD motif